MKSEKIKSLLTSFLWLSLILMIATLVVGSIVSICEIIGGKATLNFLLKKVYIAVVLLGYSFAIYILLRLADNFKENPFIQSNVKHFNTIGYIFFIEAIIEVAYSSIFNPDHGLIQILGLNITIGLVTLVIISLTFFLIADIFGKAIKIKEYNDLTI
ncbi:DUF2975 domain-containing protein [Clostridium scatologenes]|uniref:DUF2975 domain-containing protein n=1 Tax=Clostridium scatologenes TaxID=1548 RepID=A0A0E3JX44_CLOSL|nr:DUF2975 domain-containing protein [Clostridium scatologenes]AKA67749.1 hypothetical protein CSCA_0624 [Clostridium scatologenes]